MYEFGAQQQIRGDHHAVWSTWTDMNRFPEWDPREVSTSLNGPFGVGTTVDSKQRGNPGGTSTITEVTPESSWTVESPLPGGKLVIDHLLSSDGDGRLTVAKRYIVSGPLTPLFRFWYGPRVRKSLPASFCAREAEAARRG